VGDRNAHAARNLVGRPSIRVARPSKGMRSLIKKIVGGGKNKRREGPSKGDKKVIGTNA